MWETADAGFQGNKSLKTLTREFFEPMLAFLKQNLETFWKWIMGFLPGHILKMTSQS